MPSSRTPRNFDFIRKNISINDFHNIYAIEKAVSDKEGGDVFYTHGPHSALGYNRFNNTKTRITVGTVSLDGFFGDNQRIDFAKIDTEGSDAKVLRGMKGLLTSNRNIKLIIEFYPALMRAAGDSPQGFLRELTGHGFTLYDIDGKYGVEKPISPDELLNKSYYEKATNLFCRRE